jgi:hypothetical protein
MTRVASFTFDVNTLFKHRLDHHKNALEIVTGEPGSGKSFTGLSQCEDLNPDFSIDNCAFGIKEFISLLGRTRPTRDIILFEEAGVEFAARKAMSKTNIDISSVLNVFRFRQTPTIFTVPDLRMIDLNARRLMNFYVNTLRVDDREECVIATFYVVKPLGWEEGLKRYKIRVWCRDSGERVVFDFVRFHKPKSKKLVDDYMKKMEEYKQGVLDKIGMSYEELVEGKKPTSEKPRRKPRADGQRKPDYTKRPKQNIEMVAKPP